MTAHGLQPEWSDAKTSWPFTDREVPREMADRFREMSRPVLVCGKNGSLPFVEIARVFVPHSNQTPYWWFARNDQLLFEVTHWRDVPKLPKEFDGVQRKCSPVATSD